MATTAGDALRERISTAVDEVCPDELDFDEVTEASAAFLDAYVAMIAMYYQLSNDQRDDLTRRLVRITGDELQKSQRTLLDSN